MLEKNLWQRPIFGHRRSLGLDSFVSASLPQVIAVTRAAVPTVRSHLR